VTVPASRGRRHALNLTGRIAERELEAALMGRLERFLLELGHGFAFAGRQYH